jgi:SAM-dependent methyltransferase
MPDHAEELICLLKDAALAETLRKVVFSSPRSAESLYLRVSVRPVEVRGRRMLQFSSQSATQEFHQNYEGETAASELAHLALKVFRNVRITTVSGIFEGRFSRKGKCFLRKESSPVEPAVPPAVDHNRTRNYLIPEGVPCPFLIHTGVMTRDGAVKASHSRKFRQINRFLEFISDVIDLLPTDQPINAVDFGCGKSYLTFATQYLLTTLLKRECRIIGLDRRPDVVETCSRVVQHLGLSNLDFCVGDISGYESPVPVDLVISLHACDTATDEALAQAVRWNSRVILAVPCCQHEVNEHLSENALSPLTSYGLTKERFASLATDSMRASLMTAADYQTQILEFIDMEHTPKNLLIRSVRRSHRNGSDSAARALSDVRRLREQLNIPPMTLERRLVEAGRLPPEHLHSVEFGGEERAAIVLATPEGRGSFL